MFGRPALDKGGIFSAKVTHILLPRTHKSTFHWNKSHTCFFFDILQFFANFYDERIAKVRVKCKDVATRKNFRKGHACDDKPGKPRFHFSCINFSKLCQISTMKNEKSVIQQRKLFFTAQGVKKVGLYRVQVFQDNISYEKFYLLVDFP